jgi:glutamate synthase (NADPH/NADH) small chain
MPAYRHEFLEAVGEGVRFLWQAAPVRFVGEAGRLTGVGCERMRAGEPDASGRRRPEPVPGSGFTLAVDTVVEAIGQEPRTAFLRRIPGVEFAHGRIVADPATGQTGNPRYFAGGDAVNGGDTVVAAVAGGKIAAAGIHRLLGGRAPGAERDI